MSRRFGGTVKVVVLDNLREGVFTADVYDPALNPLYRNVLAHDGVVDEAARAAVEIGVLTIALSTAPVAPQRLTWHGKIASDGVVYWDSRVAP